jgi:hypothetical protein
MEATLVKDVAAERAADAATHGYNSHDGGGAALLRECARSVRIAARKLHGCHGIPKVGPAERADYTSELVARLLGEHDGYVPDASTLARGYLVRRAEGLILNDRHRRNLNALSDDVEPSRVGGEPEPDRRDPRLTGPLSVPADIEAVAERLPITETGKRALVAAMVPATRDEWAEYFGYASADAWRTIAKRGRRELRTVDPAEISRAQAEVDAIWDTLDKDCELERLAAEMEQS